MDHVITKLVKLIKKEPTRLELMSYFLKVSYSIIYFNKKIINKLSFHKVIFRFFDKKGLNNPSQKFSQIQGVPKILLVLSRLLNQSFYVLSA